MPDINITVAHKVAVSDTQSIVCDNSDYTVHWTLDDEWSAYDTKTMRTIYMDGTYTDTVFSGAEVELPVCTVPGMVQIGLFAGDIRTSRVAILRALPSVRSAAGAPGDPAPNVYDQIMELIKGLGGADPEAIKTAVAEYLAAHPIEETDPTVPAWAKAETKPTYSAAEVGAIAQSDLQTATDAALAQAKASGEFDGARGPQGPAGPTGSDASVTAENIEAAMGYKPADPTKYLPLTGGKLTGNLEGKYITGTRLKSTDAGHQESAATKVAVLDAHGWIYYRTPADLMADMGIADGTEVSY